MLVATLAGCGAAVRHSGPPAGSGHGPGANPNGGQGTGTDGSGRSGSTGPGGGSGSGGSGPGGSGSGGSGGSGSGGSGGANGPGAGSPVPARDSFQGTIRSGTGSFSGFTGGTRVFLRPVGNGNQRSVTITLVGVPCAGAGHCLALSGTATGRLSEARSRLPDVGHSEVLTGAGSIKPLGHAIIHGSIHGTGFIQHGRETLVLTVSNPSGSVTLELISPPVKGFSSP